MLFKKKFSILTQKFKYGKNLKFSDVLGQTSARKVISIRPAGVPPIAISKKTTGFMSKNICNPKKDKEKFSTEGMILCTFYSVVLFDSAERFHEDAH
jgi:hypothetical protein